MAEALGERVRRLRVEADLTLEGLAERSGVSDRTISDIERGASLGPQRRTVELLADALQVGDDDREALLAAAREGRIRTLPSRPGRAPLPRAAADFTGRQREVARLTARLMEGTPRTPAPVTVVSGPPGFGKTSLAVHAATLVVADADACFFVDLRGYDAEPLDTLAVLTRLIGVADPTAVQVPRELEDAGEVWRAAISGRRVVVVLDNASSEDQVREALPRLGPAAAVVTSRGLLSGLEVVERIVLGELSAEESRAMLRRIVPARQLEDQDLDRLAGLCGHVPLALRISANRLAGRDSWTADDLADRLASEDRRIDGLRAGDLEIRSTIALSYDRLSPPARRAFRRLGLLSGATFGSAVQARLAGTDPDAAAAILEELSDLGLVQQAGEGRFQLHDLLRIFARERLVAEEDDDARTGVAAAVRHWLLRTAVDAGRWFEPDHARGPADVDPLVDLSTAEAAETWLRSEVEHWLAALQEAARLGEHGLVVDVAEALHWFSDTWAYWGRWHEVYGLGVAAARALDDPDVLATQLGYLAWSELVRSDGEAAYRYAVEGAEVARESDSLQVRGWATFYVGWTARNVGKLEESVELGPVAAAMLLEAGDVEGYLQALRVGSNALAVLGRHEEAIAAEQEVLSAIEDLHDRLNSRVADFTRVTASTAVTRALVRLERWPEAVEAATVALGHQERLAVLSMHVDTLRLRASALAATGRRAEAIADLERALRVIEPTGSADLRDETTRMLDDLASRPGEGTP